MDKLKILFVEDDKNMGFLLRENLRLEGFDVTLSRDGESAWKFYNQFDYDLLILDIMLPQKDGLSLAKEIRTKDVDTPIIFLTARSMPSDKVVGFQIGCDDYIIKPFNEEELIYRIKAIMKRVKSEHRVISESNVQLGKISINFRERKINCEGKELNISAKEAALIWILFQNKNKVVSRGTILKEVWGKKDYFTSKSLDVYLSKIRKYLKFDSDVILLNIHGFGYKLVC